MNFDVIVIGSGQAGVPLATRLARGGKAVLLVERAELGGTCTHTGCTPTKTLLASARAAHVARTGARLGIRAESVHVELPAIMARKDAIVRTWQEGVAARIAGAEVSSADGRIAFRLAGGDVVAGSHLLVATSRRPNTDDLRCDSAGVALDAAGFVRVDDDYATSAPGIYAVGDCTGGPPFTHAEECKPS